MRSPANKSSSSRKGLAAVELAVVSPLIVLIFFGSVEIAQFVNASQLVSNASREAARKASRADVSSVSQVEAHVKDYLDSAAGMPESGIQVTVWDQDKNILTGNDLGSIASGDAVIVEVDVDYEASRWIHFLTLQNDANLSTSTASRRE